MVGFSFFLLFVCVFAGVSVTFMLDSARSVMAAFSVIVSTTPQGRTVPAVNEASRPSHGNPDHTCPHLMDPLTHVSGCDIYYIRYQFSVQTLSVYLHNLIPVCIWPNSILQVICITVVTNISNRGIYVGTYICYIQQCFRSPLMHM